MMPEYGLLVVVFLVGIFVTVLGLLWIALDVRAHLAALNAKPTGRHGPVK
jgi:hypothetical protein